MDNQALADAGADFLARDFEQSFEQSRHYDDQLWSVCQFAFTGYTTVIPIAIGLFEYSAQTLVSAAVALLAVSFVLGLFLFAVMIRNRVYFVFVTRYLNEHRDFFLKAKPLGFENTTQMFTDRTKPPFFDWRSSEAWLFYIVGLLNSLAAGSAIWMLFSSWPYLWVVTASIFVVTQVWVAVSYLGSREGRSASDAVF